MLAHEVPAVPVVTAAVRTGTRARPGGLAEGGGIVMELLLIFGAVNGAFLIGRLLQYLSDAKNVLGRSNDRNSKQR